MYRKLIGLVTLALCTPITLLAYLGLGVPQNSEGITSLVFLNRFVADKPHRFKMRTVTAGINLKNTSDLATVEDAISFLQRAKSKLQDQGYEIQNR